MANTAQVEVWVVVDENGDYAVGADDDGAYDAYDETVGGTRLARRAVKVTLTVPLPETVELTGTAPECGAAELAAVN